MILVVIGPGGVGKGTVIGRLLERDGNLWLSRSWTTRPRRSGESEDAYNFVERDAFVERGREGGFLEHAEILGELYGTPVPEPPPGKDVVLEIDVQGARQVRHVDPSAVVVLLVPPSEPEQAARLRGRGDPEQHVARRIELGRQEIAEGRGLASAVVVNDDVDKTVDTLLAIIEEARRVRARSEEERSQRPAGTSPIHEGA